MKQLKISTRITLAFFVLSAVLLAILIPSAYILVKMTLQNSLAGDMQLSESAIADAMFEKNGTVYIDETSFTKDTVKPGVYVQVTDTAGKILYQSTDADIVFIIAGYEQGNVKEEDEWTFLEKTETIGDHTVHVSVLGNIYFNDFLNDFIWIVLFLVPGYLLLAVIGAKVLAKRALKPINQITMTAKKISEGKDLSKRIEGIAIEDEVGELADMFNRMIAALEVSFQRERQFTSDASHELRTPMTVINACTEDALYTGDAEIRTENLKMIQKENERMTKMLSQLLMLSRGYEGRYHFQPEQLNLYDIADSVADSMSVMAAAKSITIHNQISEEQYIEADQSLLTQLLVNLVENAIKYGKNGGNIWIYMQNPASGWMLCVKDNGVGIGKEDMRHVFERFYRADKARNRNGSGLGLSIVKWIVTLHGWDISVKSAVNAGTTMMITGT